MTPDISSRPVRVLIVDDEPDVETLIRQRFRRRNGEFEFLFARNGREALERVAADPSLDLVITDINMPVMDGLALLSNLNSLDNRLIKAVILSAYGDMQNIRAAMNAGAFDFLTKPIDFQDFETTLKRTHEALWATRQGLQARAQLTALEQELEIASRIQSSMLPREFLAGRTEFGIFAEMLPARHVGGDFYDFFFIDEPRLGFLIGDVSGKGVPAALFMAVSRTLLRAAALQGCEPAACLTYANQILGRQSEEGVFVTAFYGILHTTTGKLDFALAGHNPPYLMSAAGELRTVDSPGGMVVGLLPDTTYETGELMLQAGDSLVLFTDGVTEAMDPQDSFFGEKRLREVLRAVAGRPPLDVVRAVLRAVSEFTSGAPQSDDITVLTVRYQGPAGSSTLVI